MKWFNSTSEAVNLALTICVLVLVILIAISKS